MNINAKSGGFDLFGGIKKLLGIAKPTATT